MPAARRALRYTVEPAVRCGSRCVMLSLDCSLHLADPVHPVNLVNVLSCRVVDRVRRVDGLLP